MKTRTVGLVCVIVRVCVCVARRRSVGWLRRDGDAQRETRDVRDDDVGVGVFGVVADRSTMGSGTRKRFAEKRRGASVREQDDDG